MFKGTLGSSHVGGADEYSGLGSALHYATPVDVGSGELWTPFKTLFNTVNRTIQSPTAESIQNFREQVTKCKSHFQSKQLLTCRGKSTLDREELKKSVTETIYFVGHREGQNLPVQLVSETILLSDLFDINEFLALDLLVTGEAEMDNYPTWPRGLIAVYIYFEGQFSLAATFRTLLRLCPGNMWGSNVNPKIIEISSSIIEQALSNDLVDKVLNLIEKYDLRKQMEALDNHLGLGDWRHRTGVFTLLKALRNSLGEILFCWAAQRGFGWSDTLRILEYLKCHIALRQDNRFDKCDLYLISTVLCAIDHNLNSETFNKSFANDIKKYYLDNISSRSFQCPEVLELVRLAFHVAIHRRVAETSLNSFHGGISYSLSLGTELIGDEDLLFKSDVFNFMKSDLFRDKEIFSQDEHVMRLFHRLFCDFISFMPLKLKDMKSRSEENWKLAEIHYDQGLGRPVDLPREYENFLECLGSFYRADPELELGKDYFRAEPLYGALGKLVRCLCIDSPPLFLSNVIMLSGLGISYTSGVFDILKQAGHNLSLEHFYDSITKYFQTVGSQLLNDVALPSSQGSFYQTDMFQRVLSPSKLKPNEILGICAYLDLLKNLCSKGFVKNYFTTLKKHWFQLTMISAKERGFPMEIRVHLLDVAAAMVIVDPPSTEYVMNLWEIFYSTKFIEPGTSDIKEELEEKETRLESYPLTVNFLKLIDALVESRFSGSEQSSYFDLSEGTTIDGTLFEPYVTYVRVSVLQKLPYRAYRNIKERWILTKLALQIISNLLDFVPNLMVQMLCDSTLLRTCLAVLVDAAKIRDMSTGPITYVDECSLECLKLIARVYARQSSYLFGRDSGVKHNVVLVGIQELLMKVHHESGRSEYLLALLKFVDKLNPEGHRDLALQILSKIVSAHSDTDKQLYVTVTADLNLSAIIRYTFCECLDDINCADDVQNDVLDLLSSSVVHASPNFAFFMLGIERKIDFQNPGVNGYPRTVLHSLLENLADLRVAFHTLYVLIRDPRISNPLLRYLRTNQVLVKFYLEHFPSLEMDVEALGYFLKCVAIELRSVQQPGPLAHALVGQHSYKFLTVFEKIEIESETLEFPNLEFFDLDQVRRAFQECQCMDKNLKVALIDCKKLEEVFIEDISQLDRATLLRLRKSIHGEAKEILAYVNRWNEMRRREASKIFLFDCWTQCLDMIVLPVGSLMLAGVDFLTSMLRLLTEKIVNSEESSEAFQRRAAQSSLTLCSVLNVFTEELSDAMLNLLLNGMCSWIAQETSAIIRALLYSSVLYVMKIMKQKKITASSHSSFALIIDTLCKDGQSATDIWKMLSLYLLGEIICWNMSKGLGGVVPSLPKPSDKQTEMVTTKRSFEQGTSYFEDSSKNFSPRNPSLKPTSSSKHGTSMFDIPSSISFRLLMSEADRNLLPSLVMERTNETIRTTQTALMTFLYSKGFLKNIVSSLSLSDDERLLKLFTSKQDASHYRSLLVYEAKLFMLTRFAKSGAAATQLLLSANLMQRLADMKVFDGVYNLEDGRKEPRLPEYSYIMSSDLIGEKAVPSKGQTMEVLYTSVLTLFHAMVSVSKSEPLMQGIWHFITVRDGALGSLISYPEVDDKINKVTFFLSSLVGLVGKYVPEEYKKTTVYNKLAGVLRNHVRMCGQSLEQLHIVRDAMLFFFRYSTREAIQSSKSHLCQVILSAKMDFSTQTAATNTEIDLSIGLILRLVHNTSKLVYQEYDHEDKRTNYLVEIMETGLTMAYAHVEITMKGMLTKPIEFQRDQQIFQRDLQNLMEAGGLVKDILEATQVLVHDMDYLKTMLMRLRRLAHLQQ